MKTDKNLKVCHCHWINFLFPGAVAFVFLIYGIVFLFSGRLAELLISVVVIVLLALYIFINYKTSYIALTETKLVGHKGFMRSKTMSTPLSKIQNITITNGLFGKIFRYHTIIIDNAGSDRSEFPFPRMANAQEFVDSVQEKI